MITEWNLPTRRLGRRVIVYAQTDSTNSRALDHVGMADSDGLAFLADEQIAGRGQRGRRWLAAPRSSVLLSVLLAPPDELRRPVILTAWAAVSTCELVERLTDHRPRIKWPNDVLVNDRKICGILIEQSRQGDVVATVAGIGLNVTQTEQEFQTAGLVEATSLAALGVTGYDSHEVARELLLILDHYYDWLCRGQLAKLERLWQDRLALVGKSVEIECVDQTLHGRLLQCSFDCLVLQANSSPIVLRPETIRHVRSR